MIFCKRGVHYVIGDVHDTWLDVEWAYWLFAWEAVAIMELKRVHH